MWRILAYWFAASIVVAATYGFLKYVNEAADDEDDPPENDAAVRERLERQRRAGTR